MAYVFVGWGYFVYILVGQRVCVVVAWCSSDVKLSWCNLNLAGSCIVKKWGEMCDSRCNCMFP